TQCQRKTDEYQKLQEMIGVSHKTWVSEMSRHESMMETRHKELDKLTVEVERKIAESKEPFEQIAAENKKLDIRKRDLDVLESRVRTRMRKIAEQGGVIAL